MSTGWLTFLYPHRFRSTRVGKLVAQTARQCHGSKVSKMKLNTTSRSEQRFVQRHGKAVQPLQVAGEFKNGSARENTSDSGKNDVKTSGGKALAKERNSSTENKARAKPPDDSTSAALAEESQAIWYVPSDLPLGDKTQRAAKNTSKKSPNQSKAGIAPRGNGPLEKVLQINSSAESAVDDLKQPHLHPPPFVHNFDTYTLVKDIEAGGFTNKQAITTMKALRVLLAKNLEVAKEGLVSKGDVENESYLFRAACSELRTEIQNLRKTNEEKMRRDRFLLQHEADILSQKLTQELLLLKDDVNGMFNDRKMTVRMEQRAMQSAIQELNYKITVALNSDAKSEVEGFRWVLTRRSVLAIVVMALMVLSSLRFASYRAHEQEVEQKRRENSREQAA